MVPGEQNRPTHFRLRLVSGPESEVSWWIFRIKSYGLRCVTMVCLEIDPQEAARMRPNDAALQI